MSRTASSHSLAPLRWLALIMGTSADIIASRTSPLVPPPLPALPRLRLQRCRGGLGFGGRGGTAAAVALAPLARGLCDCTCLLQLLRGSLAPDPLLPPLLAKAEEAP